MDTFANLDAHEGTVDPGGTTINLKRRSRMLQITNDAASNLRYRFNTSEEWATLQPTETLSLRFLTRTVYLSGGGAYRVWSWG